MAKKKSPRSPSIPLDDAISKAVKIYEKERRHAAPTEVIAQDAGYKSANNGAALAVLASLRYYGLLERPREGHLAVSKDVETYMYTPSEEIKRDLLHKWMRSPPTFLEIIEKYGDGLPSDATLRFDLISQGFSPSAAEALIVVFKKSADFAGLYARAGARSTPELPLNDESPPSPAKDESDDYYRSSNELAPKLAPALLGAEAESDRIPVRLREGRRAWLIIPSPFYEADKQRLKAQIDLLLTDEDIN